MKQTKKIFALLMSAIFALSMVPVQALAESGVMHDGTTAGQGTITIANTMETETYDLYRIFDLASFNDPDSTPGKHDNEQYSYVIKKSSLWYGFLTTTKLPGKSANIAVEGDPAGTVGDGQLFWIEPGTIKLTDPHGTPTTDYHVVIPTTNFTNEWDVSGTTPSSPDEGTYAYDEQNYSSPAPTKGMVKTVQSFAQLALAYARAQVGGTNRITPNYKENGTGSLDASGDISGGEVIVNGQNTLADGLEHGQPTAGKVYLGWYLMGTSTGTLASLDTTNSDVTIYEKSLKPDIKKRVLNKRVELDDGGNRGTLSFTAADLEDVAGESKRWVKNTDADVGDYVLFKTVLYTQQGVGRLRLHDVMEEGFAFVDEARTDQTSQYQYPTASTVSGEVYRVAKDSDDKYDYGLKVFHIDYEKNDDETSTFQGAYLIERNVSTGQSTSKINYQVVSGNSDLTDKCAFEVRFTDNGADEYTYYYGDSGAQRGVGENDQIVVLYWAKVTDKAELWGHSTTPTGGQSHITGNNGTELDSQHQVSQIVRNGDGRNDNYAILTYGAGSHTKMDKASVTTYQFDVVKTSADETGGTYPLLGGAEFEVYKANNSTGTGGEKDPAMTGSDAVSFATAGTNTGGVVYNATSTPLLFISATDENNKGYYRFVGDEAASGASGASTVIESSDTYEISLRGLEAGTYLIYETKAPTGYNKLAYPIVVRVFGDNDGDGVLSGTGYDENDATEGKLRYIAKTNSQADTETPTPNENINWNADVSESGSPRTYTASNNGGIQVINQTGRELPSTGGLGTKMIYTMGVVLLAGAAVLFVTKRRMGAEA